MYSNILSISSLSITKKKNLKAEKEQRKTYSAAISSVGREI